MSMSQSVICLMGPTASGKTALALKLAEQFPIDIISVDSAMIYRGMDIGTAKPARAILDATPHYLIDICDPSETYSVGDFYRDAYSQIEKSIKANRIPLLVGGTMMYFRALERGLAELPSADHKIRAGLLAEAAEHGLEYLHQKLISIDPKAGARIHPNDKQRIYRALEVYYVSGKSISDYQADTQKESKITFKWLALLPEDRAWLHQIIAERFHAMLKDGLIDEVKKLYERSDLSPSLPSIRSVNYRQVWECLSGETNYDAMVERAIAATRQLAKRQITWLRSFPHLEVLSDQLGQQVEYCSQIIQCC